jgi:hypothetical protein
MAISHRFTISTSTAKELYEHNYSKYLCGIHNACYPFEETAMGTTYLWATSPENLAGFLLEDGVNFYYESHDLEERTELQRLEYENQHLSKQYDALMMDNDRIRSELLSLKAEHVKRGEEITKLNYRLQQIRTFTN